MTTHLAPTQGFGGPATSFSHFVDFLDKANISYETVSATHQPSYSVNRAWGVSHYYHTKFGLKYGLSVTLLVSTIIKLTKHRVIVINGLTNPPLFLGAVAGLLYGKRVILFTRGGLEASRVCSWNLFKRKYYELNLLILKKLSRKNKLTVVFQSEDEKSRSVDLTDQAFICSNYQLDQLTDKKHSFRKFHICYVGRFSHEKGSDRIEELIKFCSSEIQPEKIKLTLFIASQEQIDAIEKYRSLPWLTIVYNASYAEVRDLFQQANIVFFPSRLENYGNALVEAVFHGLLPCVTDETHWKVLLEKNAALSVDDLKSILKQNKISDEALSKKAQKAQNLVVEKFVIGYDFEQLMKSLS